MRDEETRTLRLNNEDFTAECNSLKKQVEDLSKRLKEASEQRALLESNYEKELQCQMKAAQVYKQAADEAEVKIEELTKALENVQILFAEAKENHFSMEEQLKAVASQYENKLSASGSEIAALKDELAHANELLHSKNRCML